MRNAWRSWSLAGLMATALLVQPGGWTGAAATPPVPAAVTVPLRAHPASDPLVRLVRSGGFIGTLDRVGVSYDGRVRVRRNDGPVMAFRLTARQLERLRTTLAAAHLRRLAPHYPAPGADMFEYAVTAHGVTVTATETAVPPALQPLIDALMGYLMPQR